MPPILNIGNLKISENHPTFIIAEIGQNHQGDLNTAKELIKIAKHSGADCVKFQKTCLSEKFTASTLSRPYINKNSWGDTYGLHKEYLEFTNQEILQLQAFAKELDILFTASAMDSVSLKFLKSINVPFIKIGSGDSNNLMLIEEASQMDIPLVISTGMLSFSGVQKIYSTVSKYHKNFALLHCISSYPTPIEDINLRVINLYKQAFPDIVVGYSGHELGIDITLSAIALGANILERHITLDKNQKGSDHKSSLGPNELKILIQKARNIEKALGVPFKIFQNCEQSCYEKLGKCVVAGRLLQKGHKLNYNDLKIKVATPKGLDAGLVESIIGKKLICDVNEDACINKDMLIYFFLSYFHT